MPQVFLNDSLILYQPQRVVDLPIIASHLPPRSRLEPCPTSGRYCTLRAGLSGDLYRVICLLLRCFRSTIRGPCGATKCSTVRKASARNYTTGCSSFTNHVTNGWSIHDSKDVWSWPSQIYRQFARQCQTRALILSPMGPTRSILMRCLFRRKKIPSYFTVILVMHPM